jgi:SAM-dependent methyltransferase
MHRHAQQQAKRIDENVAPATCDLLARIEALRVPPMTSDRETWVYGDYMPDPTRRDLVGLKANWIAQRIAKCSPRQVLDYGCGEGKHLQLIKHLQPNVACIGADIRPLHSERDFEFYQIEPIGLLPFADCSFDVVISCDVLEHVESMDHSLNEIQRVLQPGGAFVGFVPLEGGFSPYTLFRAFSPNLYRDTKDHVRNLTKREMLAYLSARFRIIQLVYSYHLLGACMDAAFFACFRLPVVGRQVESFWRGTENPIYHQSNDQQRPSVFSQLIGFCNKLSYYESTILRNVSIGACGLHFHVEKAA